MKKIFFSLLLITLSAFVLQEIPKSVSYNKNGELIVNYSTSSKKVNLTKLGYSGLKCSRFAVLTNDKNFVSFISDADDNIKLSEEDKKNSVIIYDVLNNKLLFSISVNYLDSETIDYSNSTKYPFKKLNSIQKAYFNSKNNTVVFETLAWAVCNSVHIYENNSKKVKFVTAGNLKNYFTNGMFSVELTGVSEDKGRWTMEALYDSNGKFVKNLTAKTY